MNKNRTKKKNANHASNRNNKSSDIEGKPSSEIINEIANIHEDNNIETTDNADKRDNKNLDITINDFETNDCLICYESNKTIKLEYFKLYYFTSCECNIYIHKDCLKNWLKIKDTCPLCRAIYYSKEKYIKEISYAFLKKIKQLANGMCVLLIIFYITVQITEIIIHGSTYRY